MDIKKRISRRVLISGLAASPLAACGPWQTAGRTAPAEVGPATLDVQFNFQPVEHVYLERHVGSFMQQHPQIRVNWASTAGEEHYKKLTTMVAAGTQPHLSHMTSRWAGQFLRGQRVYTDLSPLVRADRFNIQDFWPLLMEGFADEQGRPMVLPYDITVQLLFFNTDLLLGAGAPLPADRWTLDDLLAAAQRATRRDGTAG